MKKLKFTAFLKTPIIFRGYLTFDALLAGILFDRIDDPAKAHESIPIKHTDGLFHASAAVVEGFNHIEKVSFSASLKAKHDLDPQLFKQNKSGTGPHRTLGEKRRRDFGNVLSTYNAIHAQAVSWHCEGDEPAISDLLKDARYIGKRRASGFGQVEKWDKVETDLDGLVDADGKPMRPIPVDLFKGDRSQPILDAAWKPAYWDPANRAPCHAPSLLS